MTRLILGLTVGCSLLLSGPTTATADWWPFGKSDDKQKPKASAQKPIKPTPTTNANAKKSSSWNWFGSSKPAKPTTTRVSPLGPTPVAARKEPESKSWFSSMFQKEEPKKYQSIDDFMSAERPSP